MKRQLRCHEADVCDVYEAKHTLTSPCAEGTLHRRSRLHFSYTLGCASFAPQFIQEIIKNAQPRLSIFCIRQSRNYTPCELHLLGGGASHYVLLFAKRSRSNLHSLADESEKMKSPTVMKSALADEIFTSFRWNPRTSLGLNEICHPT